ncbi:MAG: T9SS type A sorting domain-containing protein [Bacteroidales bacterium]|nr:T9SS type A sorting domain-containing protein [Bacteroidales bacterium]
MKTIFTLIFLLFFSGNIFSQNYSFSSFTETYSDLVGATDLTNGEPWSYLDFNIPIGFDFEFYGQSFDEVHIRGYIHFDQGDYYFINQFFVGLFVDRGDSPVSYLLEGSPGNRILKLEWKNMGFWGEYNALGTMDDYVNSQLWLYEGSNNIEILIGPNSVMHPDESYSGLGGPWIGIAHIISYSPGAEVESISLSGNPANPDLVYNDTTFLINLTGTPANSMIYKFTYILNNIKTIENTDIFEIYPNPTDGLLYITSANTNQQVKSLIISDITGKVVYHNKSFNFIKDNDIVIDLSALENGIYLVKIITDKQTRYKKILKQ